jgi:excisionase family DNA binding protein
MTGMTVLELERRVFFTPRTLARYLSLSDRTVREILRTGKIPSYKARGVGGAARDPHARGRPG